jgi:hypothetical protein
MPVMRDGRRFGQAPAVVRSGASDPVKHGPRFGDNVVVQAETVRIIGKLDENGAPVIRQSWSSRDAGRYVRREFPDATFWPGWPLELDVRGVADNFELEPALNDDVVVRLRRLPAAVPEVGVVVGFTWKEEGVVRGGRADDPAFLSGPGRGRINLIEVALPSTARARVVLAHVDDLGVLARARGAA